MLKPLASLLLVASLLTPLPVVAQQLNPSDDKLLWCASAFYWLAGTAEDSGDTEEAALYDRWSQRLLEIAGASLIEAGVLPERIEALIAEYDQAALEQLGLPDAPHDVATCPDLLGPWR